MSKFKKVLNNILTENINIKPFEDYSMKIQIFESKNIPGKCYQYVDCNNNNIISEDSLSRTMSIMKDKDFAILTAYRGNFTKEENIQRNRVLRGKLNEAGMGPHQLVGHWQEAPAGKDYEDCEPGELTDVVERSYLVAKPDNMSFEEFTNFILELLTIEGETQDAAILKNDEGIFLLYNNGSIDQIGTGCELGKIAQAYSQHVKKQNVPFVFEGVEIPGTNAGRQMFKLNNIKYTPIGRNIITESSISKILNYVQNFECAAISASRGKITNITPATYIPEGYVEGTELTKEENKARNSELKAKLLKLGYGVTSLDGKYAEEGMTYPGKETSYFVVNRTDDPNFKDQIFKLSEYYNQDSFLYKPINSMNAELIGTNNAERDPNFGVPGYNHSIDVGEFHPNGFDGALSLIGNKAFQFRLNEHKEHNRLFIADNILCEETFNKLTNVSKAAVTKTAKKVKI